MPGVAEGFSGNRFWRPTYTQPKKYPTVCPIYLIKLPFFTNLEVYLKTWKFQFFSIILTWIKEFWSKNFHSMWFHKEPNLKIAKNDPFLTVCKIKGSRNLCSKTHWVLSLTYIKLIEKWLNLHYYEVIFLLS